VRNQVSDQLNIPIGVKSHEVSAQYIAVFDSVPVIGSENLYAHFFTPAFQHQQHITLFSSSPIEKLT
jgi:hypothetical protein